MIKDQVLVWRFNRGSTDALSCIYMRYRADLLSLAFTLLHDVSAAEDVVHDVFVGFTQSAGECHLSGSLRGYLATCVANHARNVRRRTRRQQTLGLDETETIASGLNRPEQELICREETQKIQRFLLQLPHEQREVVVLHIQYGVRFRQIAQAENVSINTIKSRYQYGLHKLRSLLNGEAKK